MAEKFQQNSFKFLWNIFKNVQKETKEKTGDEFYTWSEHYNNWIDIIQPLASSKPILFENSLLGVRFLEFNRILLWIQTCVHSGQYYSALRELRFLLEFILKAYYLDKKYPHLTLKSKINNEEKLFGRLLINELDLSEINKNKLKNLYRDLCVYTHPTKEELKPILLKDFGNRITFVFDKEFFQECIEFTNRVVDVVFFIFLKENYDIINQLKKNSSLISSLKELKYELTLSIM